MKVLHTLSKALQRVISGLKVLTNIDFQLFPLSSGAKGHCKLRISLN